MGLTLLFIKKYVKYITRWRKKGGVEDLKKAKQYIDIIIEKEGVPTVTDTKD